MYGGGGQSGHGHYIIFLYTGYPGTGDLDPPTGLGLATPLVITAQSNPLIDWSTTMFDNVLSQGDQMYFKALNKGLIVLEQDDEFLSMDNLPKVVIVSGCSSMFS